MHRRRHSTDDAAQRKRGIARTSCRRTERVADMPDSLHQGGQSDFFAQATDENFYRLGVVFVFPLPDALA